MLDRCAASYCFWDMWYIFLYSLINKKLKKNSIYLKRNVVLQYAMLFKVGGQYIFSLFVSLRKNAFIQDGCVKWIKGHSKAWYYLKILIFWTNAAQFNFVFIKEKSIICSKKQYEAAQQFQHS